MLTLFTIVNNAVVRYLAVDSPAGRPLRQIACTWRTASCVAGIAGKPAKLDTVGAVVLLRCKSPLKLSAKSE